MVIRVIIEVMDDIRVVQKLCTDPLLHTSMNLGKIKFIFKSFIFTFL